MALTDPTKSRVVELDTELSNYAAGFEPWNKNLDTFNIPGRESGDLTYLCDWNKWHGIYRKIPEVRMSIDTEARWVISKEINLKNKAAKEFAKKVKGNGKMTLRKVLFNIYRTGLVGGDSVAWAPRDKANRLMNLKILNPGSIEFRADKFGVIKEYAQVSFSQATSKIDGQKTTMDTWTPEEIFHFSNDPIADDIHGIPEPEKTLDIIRWRHLMMGSTATIFQRYGKPTNFFEANTDDETELEEIRAILAKAKKDFDDAVVPKGTLEKIQQVATAQYSSLDPMPFIKFLRTYHTESSGVPDIVRGKSDEVSLAAGKLNVLSYKEKIIMRQMEFEEELEKQLGLEVEFERPTQLDVEIARTEEEMNLKEKAKKQSGGDKIVTSSKLTSTDKGTQKV